MQPRRVVDTSWLYALFDEADPHHDRALEQGREAGLYQVPSEILAETLALRYARAPREKPRAAAVLLESILAAGFQVIGLADATPALDLYRAGRGLSYPDAVACVQAAEADLLTFDKRQARIWRSARRGVGQETGGPA